LHGIVDNPVDIKFKGIGLVTERSLSVEKDVVSDSFHGGESEIDGGRGCFIDGSGLISNSKTV
jgi:hypothetical protein